ncbi:hypothetical protein L596_016294 [Steinernema carpocapsae]|uniref:Beta-Casp domain-containing protein n=1 Tax=Steinernema carpocapsae TaxID=34508 RepID=A0A4U5NHJ9_STECR|nr:hypothetical protein L596_016294 [Steinernema carpocapsae]
MEITNLSPVLTRPCYLVKMTNAKVTVLVDPMVDLSSLQSYLPFTLVPSGRIAHLPKGADGETFIRRIDDRTYVDGTPEVKIAPLHVLKMQDVDAILVSHHTGLLALPFYTEGTGFEGVVYASEPTVQLGKLVIEEFIEYLERCSSDTADAKWKDPEKWKDFKNPPTSDPREWRQFYSQKQLLSALQRVVHVSFRQSVTVGGSVTVSAYGSGYSIGSCNWKIATEHESIAYLSHSSTRQAHTNEVQWENLRRMDHLVLTTMCTDRDNSPNERVVDIGAVVVETLKKNGSVLMPMAPTGTIYDMFDLLSRNMDLGGISPDTPIYFVSPVADSTLAYANIYAEYLSEQKQKRVYIPDEPFAHTELVKKGRLRVYPSIHGDFSRQFKTPCVMITGHPSLRVGDAVHFLEMWGNDGKNSIIITDPDYPLEAVYGPFKSLAISAYHFPVETRLDHSQFVKIIGELSPRHLLTSPDIKGSIEHFWKILGEIRKSNEGGKYAISTLRGDFDLKQLELYRRIRDTVPHMPPYPTDRIQAMPYGLPWILNSAKPTRKVRVHPDVLRGVNVTGRGQTASLGMGAMRGYLSVYDNVYELNPVPDNELHRVRKRLYGVLDLVLLQKKLSGLKVTCTVSTGEDRSTTLETNCGTIWVDAKKLKTKITAKRKEDRARLADIVRHCLKSL